VQEEQDKLAALTIFESLIENLSDAGTFELIRVTNESTLQTSNRTTIQTRVIVHLTEYKR
jgi:hypothetical protein